ncbi:MAG: DUF4382 domain-containing protein [Terriglobales bacterium]
MRKSTTTSLATAVAFGLVLMMSACSGNSSSSSFGTSPGSGSFNGPGPDGQAVITASDAPMPGVLAAQITVGTITAANANGTTLTLIANPVTFEIAHSGISQILLDVDPLPQGTYNSVTFTVTGANFTYMNGTTVTYATSNPPVTTPATPPTVTIPAASQSLTYTFTAPIVVNTQASTYLNFDFNLAQELDLASGMVTFSPTVAVTTAGTTTPGNVNITMAPVTSLTTAQADVNVSGTVASVDTSNSSLVLTADTGYGETIYTSATTVYSGALSLSNLAVGATARSDAQINADGSLSAISLETADNGVAEIPNAKTGVALGSVNDGVVVGMTGTGFNMVVTNSSTPALVGQEIGVVVATGATGATTFSAAAGADDAGQPACQLDTGGLGQPVCVAYFDATQVFPGQSVWVAGATDTTLSTATSTVIDATTVTQSAVNMYATTTAAPSANDGSDGQTVVSYVFLLSTTFSNLPAGTAVSALALTCATVGTTAAFAGCTAANLDGPYLQFGAAPAPPAEPVGDTVEARGYLSQSGGDYGLGLTDINDPTAIPAPAAGGSGGSL